MNRFYFTKVYGILSIAVILVSGCRGGFANIERPKGQIEYRRPESKPISVMIDPATSSLSKEGVDVTIRFASHEELNKFFENNLKFISKVILVKLPEDQKPFSLDEFVDMQEKYIESKTGFLVSKNVEVERAVDDLIITI